MDFSDRSSKRGNLLALCIVLGLILFAHAANEARYALWGKTATAWVMNTTRWQTHAKNTTWNRLRIDYTFIDADGVQRTESDETASSCAPPAAPEIGQTIQVQYLQPGNSRPASNADFGSIYLCGVVMLIGLMWFAASALP